MIVQLIETVLQALKVGMQSLRISRRGGRIHVQPRDSILRLFSHLNHALDFTLVSPPGDSGSVKMSFKWTFPNRLSPLWTQGTSGLGGQWIPKATLKAKALAINRDSAVLDKVFHHIINTRIAGWTVYRYRECAPERVWKGESHL